MRPLVPKVSHGTLKKKKKKERIKKTKPQSAHQEKPGQNRKTIIFLCVPISVSLNSTTNFCLYASKLLRYLTEEIGILLGQQVILSEMLRYTVPEGFL